MPEVYSGFFVISARIRTKGILLIPQNRNFHLEIRSNLPPRYLFIVEQNLFFFFFFRRILRRLWGLFLKNILQWNYYKRFCIIKTTREIFVIKSRNFYSHSFDRSSNRLGIYVSFTF